MSESNRYPAFLPGDLDQQMATHEGLVRWVVRQQWRGEVAFAECLHAGRIGLWQVLRHYDPTRGTRFSSYAVPAIQHAVWAAVAGQRQEAARQEAAARLGGTALSDPVENVHRAQVRAALHAVVGRLPPRLRQVIVAHYGLDTGAPQSFAAIGAMLGVSRQRVQQLHVLALLWLAQPDHSRAVRRLLDRQRRRDYHQALARQRQHAWATRSDRRVRP